MIEKMRETEEFRPFSVISSNPKYNSYYLENIIKTKWLKKLNEMEEAEKQELVRLLNLYQADLLMDNDNNIAPGEEMGRYL